MINDGELINEQNRINALKEYSLLDTLPEEMFDDITKIASAICETPISLINLIDKERQYFKSHHGLEITETAREFSFCEQTIKNPNKPFEVTDARKNTLFSDNPYVINDPKIIFYYGISLVTNEGYPIGTLCVLDIKPKKLTTTQITALRSLSNQVMYLLDLRKKNKQLQSLQSQLKKHSNNMEQFAHMAAHDLKEPLRNISSFIKLITKKNNARWDETDKTYIAFINSGIRRMNQLIVDLIDYAKEGMVDSKANIINITQLITTIFNSLTENTEDEKPVLIIENMKDIKIAKTAMIIIFQNIIGNALKYKLKNTLPIIKISCEESLTHWHFTVQDNGIGIPHKYINTIFEPFKRLHTQTEYEGSGLGLASCKKIIEKYNGKISATSEPHKGTTIKFSIEKT
jgi:signal transduction histidine kinase